MTLDADVKISNKNMKKQTNREENYPGPVLIDLLCATNLRRPSNISNLNNGRNIAIFN